MGFVVRLGILPGDWGKVTPRLVGVAPPACVRTGREAGFTDSTGAGRAAASNAEMESATRDWRNRSELSEVVRAPFRGLDESQLPSGYVVATADECGVCSKALDEALQNCRRIGRQRAVNDAKAIRGTA